MIPQNDKEAITLILEGITKAGCKVTTVEDDTWNPDDITAVATVEEAVDLVTNVDEAYVFIDLPDGNEGWIRFVLGNEPIEVLCDETTSLSPYTEPITDPWWGIER